MFNKTSIASINSDGARTSTRTSTFSRQVHSTSDVFAVQHENKKLCIVCALVVFVLAFGLSLLFSTSRAYAEEAIAQEGGTGVSAQTVTNDEGVNETNYALLVENGSIEVYEGFSIQLYRLVFGYFDAVPEYYNDCKVVEAYSDILNINYFENDMPWYDYARYITQVDIVDKTCPLSTAGWFSDFRSLIEINGLENLDTSSITDMAFMFDGCKSLTKLDLSSFNTSNVENMCYMFGSCGNLNELNLSSFDTSKVGDMGSMFFCCFSLNELDVSMFNTSSVRSMLDMFTGCVSLTKLDLSGFNTFQVNDMRSMFSCCESLIELDISGFCPKNVNSMADMFSGDSMLTTIWVSDLWVVNKQTLTSGMFSDCFSLRGGAGTVYDEAHIDGEYARIDCLPLLSGYFSAKNDDKGILK